MLLDKSEEPKYYGVSDSKALDRLEQREWEVIEKEINERIDNIASRLKSIVELNYEELKDSERKTIW